MKLIKLEIRMSTFDNMFSFLRNMICVYFRYFLILVLNVSSILSTTNVIKPNMLAYPCSYHTLSQTINVLPLDIRKLI